MEGRIFDSALEKGGCSKIATTPSQVSNFGDLLDRYFYKGRSNEGRAAMPEFLQPIVSDAASTIILLACTDLAPAFPEIGDEALFEADGYHFLDVTSAHVSAILRSAQLA